MKKIETFEGIFARLATPSIRSRILCGDFNSPRHETVDGQLIYGDAYELELADPRLDRAIRTQYAVRVLERDPR